MADIDINTAPPTADVDDDDYVVVIKKEAVSAPGTPTAEADGLAANHALNVVKIEDLPGGSVVSDDGIDTDTPSNESQLTAASRQSIAEMGRDILDAFDRTPDPSRIVFGAIRSSLRVDAKPVSVSGVAAQAMIGTIPEFDVGITLPQSIAGGTIGVLPMFDVGITL